MKPYYTDECTWKRAKPGQHPVWVFELQRWLISCESSTFDRLISQTAELVHQSLALDYWGSVSTPDSHTHEKNCLFWRWVESCDTAAAYLPLANLKHMCQDTWPAILVHNISLTLWKELERTNSKGMLKQSKAVLWNGWQQGGFFLKLATLEVHSFCGYNEYT